LIIIMISNLLYSKKTNKNNKTLPKGIKKSKYEF
jgi:hypothetical protein